MIIQGLSQYKEDLVEILFQAYNPYYPDMSKKDILEALDPIDYDLSLGYIKEGKLVAVYILKELNEPTNNYKGKGLRGDALAVIPLLQRKGIGDSLVEYVKEKFGNNYDYFWGTQAFVLKNELFWNKHRSIYYKDSKRNYSIFEWSKNE